ncbi:MAG: hypothetical protein A2927_03185 [Candidatus Komeilibacteria bacterium RIFCSPLOWO2_01_FULL_45_10]|uniref:Uncharacterized protein n=1 Tax=Candidatus Komeilibacteria bacterium RIFCSPLOWO2_01_FULL_45_10 TaxID=1798550 RepID=A0A1G2BJV1_9BACT|nr:MAG: hypothetical protein A2927_03185 [Candidatus Komeilibacteria bacterium RIFCSPLOWO2_01_FULL_45_10]
MVNYQGAPLEEQVKKLLEENLAYSKEIYSLAKKINRHFKWSRIVSFIYLFLIIAPIIVGIIFLPSFLNNTINSFTGGMLNQGADAGGGKLDQKALLEEFQKQGGPVNVYKNILDLYNGQ